MLGRRPLAAGNSASQARAGVLGFVSPAPGCTLDTKGKVQTGSAGRGARSGRPSPRGAGVPVPPRRARRRACGLHQRTPLRRLPGPWSSPISDPGRAVPCREPARTKARWVVPGRKEPGLGSALIKYLTSLQRLQSGGGALVLLHLFGTVQGEA